MITRGELPGRDESARKADGTEDIMIHIKFHDLLNHIRMAEYVLRLPTTTSTQAQEFPRDLRQYYVCVMNDIVSSKDFNSRCL